MEGSCSIPAIFCSIYDRPPLLLSSYTFFRLLLGLHQCVEMDSKRPKLEEEALENLDPNLVMSMERLQETQDELEQKNEEANDKVLEIEEIYIKKRRPIYQRRNEVIQKIPEFWLTAFLSHPHLRELLTEEDQKALKYLKSLNVEYLGNIKSGYKIIFDFGPNPYFEDSKLVKVIKYLDDGSTTEAGSPPHWKDGMDLTKPSKTETKGKKRAMKTESFFNWFSEELQQNLFGIMQDEIADIIKDDLWVNPLKYFNNENESDSDDDEDDDEEDGDGDQDEDGDEDEDEDGDEDDA